MSSQAITITISARPAADTTESYWIRLVQPDSNGDFATVADAAQVLDAVFDRKPCESSTGGAEAVLNEDGTYAEAVTEEEYANVVNGVIDLDACLATDRYYWTATLDIIRSHPLEPYKLVLVGATVEQTVLVQERVTQGLIFSGESSQELEYPIISGLSVGWSGSVTTKSGVTPTVTIIGSTVNLSEAATGHLTMQYRTEYDRATIKVPGLPGEETLQSAEALAFYHYLVEPLTLSPPDIDETSAGDNLLCRGGGREVEFPETADCWETVRQYTLCTCGGKEAHPENVEVAVPCPDGTAPGYHYQGTRSVLTGYTDCGEASYDRDISKPEFYEERCCYPPTIPLPRCITTTTAMGGGKGIVLGPEFYKSLYGENTRIVGVSPRDGICGTVIWTQNIAARNCCDGVTALVADPKNPVSVIPGASVVLKVVGGKVPLAWTVSGGTFDNGLSKISTTVAEVAVTCPSPACPGAMYLTATDGCSDLDLSVGVDAPASSVNIPDAARTVAPGGTIVIDVSGGVPPYTWSASGLSLDWASGSQAAFIAPAGFCGRGSVSVHDYCGANDSAAVLSTAGHWQDYPTFDRFVNPWGRVVNAAFQISPMSGGGWWIETDGIRGRGDYTAGGISSPSGAQACSAPVWGSCEAAWASINFAGSPEMYRAPDGGSLAPSCTPVDSYTAGFWNDYRNVTICHPESWCDYKTSYVYAWSWPTSWSNCLSRGYDSWNTLVHIITSLAKWECP